MKKVLFYNNTLCHRGTSKAIYLYAKSLYSLSSDIKICYAFNRSERGNKFGFALHLLDLGVELLGVSSHVDILNISHHFNLIYYVSSSSENELSWLKQSASNATLLHQVGFQAPIFCSSFQFAYTSYWQSFYFTNGEAPVLPYIIDTPNKNCVSQADVRLKLGIPREAIVLGRHGGADTWNLPFASKVVEQAVNYKKDLYFIFAGTPQFSKHDQIIFLNEISSLVRLEDYLVACDAMIHARWEGETFGMACAEFLVRNKPIITWSESREQNHIFLAGRSAITYNNELDLLNVFLNLSNDYIRHKKTLINQHLLDLYSIENVRSKLHSYL